jgi:hypothetical protein
MIQKIIFQETEILHILQKVKKFQENQSEMIKLFNDNRDICHRINTEHNCSFCDKNASFLSTNMKYFCWFHKCQIDY